MAALPDSMSESELDVVESENEGPVLASEAPELASDDQDSPESLQRAVESEAVGPEEVSSSPPGFVVQEPETLHMSPF